MIAHAEVEEIQAVTTESEALAVHCSLTEVEAFLRRLMPEPRARVVADHLATCADCSTLASLLFAQLAPDDEEWREPNPLIAEVLRRAKGEVSYFSPSLDDEIDNTYDEIDALSSTPASADREERIACAMSRLRELQSRESKRIHREFESRLNLPIDAGARILGDIRELRRSLENLAADIPATEDPDSP